MVGLSDQIWWAMALLATLATRMSSNRHPIRVFEQIISICSRSINHEKFYSLFSFGNQLLILILWVHEITHVLSRSVVFVATSMNVSKDHAMKINIALTPEVAIDVAVGVVTLPTARENVPIPMNAL